MGHVYSARCPIIRNRAHQYQTEEELELSCKLARRHRIPVTEIQEIGLVSLYGLDPFVGEGPVSYIFAHELEEIQEQMAFDEELLKRGGLALEGLLDIWLRTRDNLLRLAELLPHAREKFEGIVAEREGAMRKIAERVAERAEA